jgi:hypothetical protein
MTGPDKTYECILRRLQSRYDSVNYTELRRAYTHTPDYSPYNDRSVIMFRDKMLSTLSEKDYDSAIKYAECSLNINYLNIEAHMVIHEAQLILGNSDDAIKHRHIADSLLNSVLSSGNGQSPRTAYKVISVQEEYAVINALGARTVRQVLVNGGDGRFYDVHEIMRFNSREKEQVYFDVSMPYQILRNSGNHTECNHKPLRRMKSFIKGIFAK